MSHSKYKMSDFFMKISSDYQKRFFYGLKSIVTEDFLNFEFQPLLILNL